MADKVTIEVDPSDLVFVVRKNGKKRIIVPSPDSDVSDCQMRGIASLAIDLITGLEVFICKTCDKEEDEFGIDVPIDTSPKKAY